MIDWLQTAVSHALSFGDGIVEAPGAILIEPQAEPLSELLKYKMFVLHISEVNFILREENSAFRLQVFVVFDNNVMVPKLRYAMYRSLWNNCEFRF